MLYVADELSVTGQRISLWQPCLPRHDNLVHQRANHTYTTLRMLVRMGAGQAASDPI